MRRRATLYEEARWERLLKRRNMRVTSPEQGIYWVHEEDQRPDYGVTVFYYKPGHWSCEVHGHLTGTTRPDCDHITLAKQEKIIALAKEEEII